MWSTDSGIVSFVVTSVDVGVSFILFEPFQTQQQRLRRVNDCVVFTLTLTVWNKL